MTDPAHEAGACEPRETARKSLVGDFGGSRAASAKVSYAERACALRGPLSWSLADDMRGWRGFHGKGVREGIGRA